MTDEKKITTDKRILLDTIKEYSNHTTIHGINYVFASFLSFNDRIFWLIIFLAGLVFSIYLSLDAFIDWRQNMIITRFENSELPVTEIAFPAVTICSQGLNMDNVAKAVERDFYEWHQQKIKNKRRKRETVQDMMSFYLKEKFDIEKDDPSILDIIQSTTSVGGGAAVKAESLTKNVKKCSAKKEDIQKKNVPKAIRENVPEKMSRVKGANIKVNGSNCPIMKNHKLDASNFTLVDGVNTLQECVDKCFASNDCLGYSFTAAKPTTNEHKCLIAHEFGRFITANGTVSGRKCNSCQLMEWTKVDGVTFEKYDGVSLDTCIELCNQKKGCTHFNYYYSKIVKDPWARCILLSQKGKTRKRNKQYVMSGRKCKNLEMLNDTPPLVEKVTKERNKSIIGKDLITVKNISSVERCIDVCHKTPYCAGYEYLGEDQEDIWKRNICNLKSSIESYNTQVSITSGLSYFICSTTHLADREAIGQNLRSFKCSSSETCLKACTETEGCVGYSQSDKLKVCVLKANIEYFQEADRVTSGQACYRPPTFTNISLTEDNFLVSKSPIMSMVLTSEPTIDCEDLGNNKTNISRKKRGINLSKDLELELDNPPNIDFLLNPKLKGKREEYEEYVMNKLRNFFKDRNSTQIYPNLFRLLWYTKTPCFDLFNMTGEHSHVLKYCEWAGEEVACENLFQAVPTDVGICCSFNFNSSLKETVYARLISELKDKERLTRKTGDTQNKEVLQGKVGFEMGLKVVIDSHSNIASPATINSDGNAFQVYIGNPSEFPFLRNRAVQIQPGHENHVEVSGIKISADPGIHSYNLHHRKCKFYDESDLVFHAGYSYTSCVVEFAMGIAVRAVQCVPWYMPQNGSSPICGPWQTSMFQKIMGRSFSANHSQSGCLPDCDSVKYSYTLSMAKFRRCDQRNLNYSPLCSLTPKFSPAPWQKSIIDIYKLAESIPVYVRQLDGVERDYYPTTIAREREIMESYTSEEYSQTYNAYENDIAVLYVYFGQPTTTEYIRVVSLSWVGFLAQAGGLIGACLGFSFISLVEIIYWFIIRFCRLSKIEKKKEKMQKAEAVSLERQSEYARSFEKVWCDGWESPCVDTIMDEEFDISSQVDCLGESQDKVELNLLSRAGSLCSLKIRHQLTVLQMYFGKRNETQG